MDLLSQWQWGRGWGSASNQRLAGDSGKQQPRTPPVGVLRQEVPLSGCEAQPGTDHFWFQPPLHLYNKSRGVPVPWGHCVSSRHRLCREPGMEEVAGALTGR